MRYNRKDMSISDDEPQTGSLLVAHPTMGDPNFCQTVIFLAAHDSAEGSLGLVINRAMGKTLGESDPEYADTELSNLPLYEGGPVATDKLILAAWRWTEDSGTFQLYFGIDGARAGQLLDENAGFEVRAFMGHAGWSEGQLDAEIEQRAWIVSRWLPQLMKKGGDQLWRSILLHENPALRLLLDAPEDPSRN